MILKETFLLYSNLVGTSYSFNLPVCAWRVIWNVNYVIQMLTFTARK